MPKWDNFKWQKPTSVAKWATPHAIVNSRIADVWKLLIQWYMRYQIVAIWADKRDLSASQIDDYIARAKTRIKAKNDLDLWDEISITEAQIMDIYQWARRDKKWGDARSALKLKMDLKWLEAPKKLTITQLDPEDADEVNKLLAANWYLDDLDDLSD